MGEFIRRTDPVEYFVDITATPTIADGSLMEWDATNLEVGLLAAGSAANCIGVAEGQIPIASNIDNTTGLENRIKVRAEGEFKFKTTSGDTYEHGLAVETGADALTIKLGTPTAANKVGIVWLPKGESIAGGAGVFVTIKIMPQYVMES